MSRKGNTESAFILAWVNFRATRRVRVSPPADASRHLSRDLDAWPGPADAQPPRTLSACDHRAPGWSIPSARRITNQFRPPRSVTPVTSVGRPSARKRAPPC